jgi:sugar phosphate isomerase/epimerase
VLNWITTLGERITYVHLHDNDGSGDQHLPLGQGNLPLLEVLAALETHAPRAIWMIEAEATASLAWLAEHSYIFIEGHQCYK